MILQELAYEFCQRRAESLALKQEAISLIQQCEEADDGEPEVGDGGTSACIYAYEWTQLELMCSFCQKAVDVLYKQRVASAEATKAWNKWRKLWLKGE